ncbi:uncharacterized protein LOC110442308 [Mizuhopecten yessoensis]|uniref:Uncharacterized protein n=1 Tax=Mizuhopecten yessoensis TaxID=6573 RepID=A0A210PHI4_MIZYE|nr:uncharacterized protein LOC110442308 [Mizuhopecten yessoensis]XP_021341514.1 uncharacterized protein LOC110442308 [Mizuhopecten yessoensis]OWF35954.1 hypothetical protein KP79_PYT23574 [Mizuhopecten yessoensis]
MVCKSKKKSQDETVTIVPSQHKQSSHEKDKGCRNNLASKYIEHMPYVWDCNSRLAVWSDVKEVLFPSCSDPECDIVLNALKIVSRYPWEDSKMQPCSPKQQMNFLRNFRLVPSGTLLVDLQFVKDKIDELWEMVWLKHGTSLDVSSRRCHYVTMQLTHRADNAQSSSDRGPSEEQTNSQECSTGMHGSEYKPREYHGLADTLEHIEEDENTQRDIEHNADTDVLHVSHSHKNSSIHQLDNDCLIDCSPRKRQQMTEEKSDQDKSSPQYRYPTIETMKIIPRRDQKDTSKTKHNGYTIMPVVKSSDKDCDGQTFPSGADISATFPQLHDYLDRLTSEFVVGHTDMSSNEIRRCSCIEGRCFTNWKIKRHGWNLPWQHMTSKDMLVSWDSVVVELQRLARNAVDVNDIFPISASGLISFKDPFLCLGDNSNTSATNVISTWNFSEQIGPSNAEKYISKITLTKLEPAPLKNPARLYDLCQAQIKSCNEQKSAPRYQVFRLERKNVNPTVNRHLVQEQGNAILIPLLKVPANSNAPNIKKESIVVRDLKRTTLDTGSKNNPTLLRVPTLQTCTRTNATNSTADMVLHAKADIYTSTPRTNIISQKTGNVDKQPKKRQRIKSPTEAATLTRVKTVNNLDTNQNALDSNSSDKNIDGPTLTQLLSHPLPTERLSVAQQLSSVTCKYSSMNQNALYRNSNDTRQSAMSGSAKQPVRRSNLFKYSTSRSIDPLDRVPCFSGSSTPGETFHHLQKCASFPKRTFEKYRGVWDRISGASSEQSGSRKLHATVEPFKSCERITTATSNSSTKSTPQWNIDQIIKEHPRRIKGDSLYGISLKKTQTRYASQLRKTSSENATKTQCNKSNSESNTTQYNKSCIESHQRRNINEVLPSLVKPKTLMPPVPSVKRSEADEYQKKEVWYRNESVSRPNTYVHADTLLEMVSANPFNQTVESMMALRQFNCDIDLLYGSISNGTIGPRSSPLPKIDTDRVPTFLPDMAGNSDINLCYQHAQTHISMASESDSNEEIPPNKNIDDRNNTRTSQNVHNERNTKSCSIKTKTDVSIKDAKEMSNQSKHCATCQTSNGIRTSPQQKIKREIAPGVDNTSDELPRLSKSENCIKTKGFKKQNTFVCKSASNPGLPSSKYKVMVNDLTLTFTRLKDNKKKTKDDDDWHTHKQGSKELKTDKECQTNSKVEAGGKMHRGGTTFEQVNIDSQKQQSGLEKQKQKGKGDDELVVGISDKRTKSSTQCHKQTTSCCQRYDVDKIAKSMESKFRNEETGPMTDSHMDGFGRPVLHLHNKKRWLIEYQQNTSNTLDSVKKEIQTTQHPEDLYGMVSCDSATDESLRSTVLESDFQTGTLLPDGSFKAGYEINLTREDRVHERKIPSITSGEESETLMENVDVEGSLSRDTAYSDITDLASSDGILLADNNELGLIEEVVVNVASVSMTEVTTQEENTQPAIAEKEENIQQTKNDLNMQTKHKEATDPESCIKDETNTSFEGSVYVFNDSKKSGSRKGSASGVNIIRRSVRQHLSPRKSMAEVSDKTIYSGSERTTSVNTKRKGKKSGKTKSASKSKAQLCAAKETATNDSLNMKDQEKTLEASFGKSCVVTDRSRENTIVRAKHADRSPEGTTSKPYTVAMETDKIREGTARKPGDKASNIIPNIDRKSASCHAKKEIEPPNHYKVKQRNITKQDMTTANSKIRHLTAEQKRMLDIINLSSSSRSKPSPESYSLQSPQSIADSSTMSSSSFSFVPIYTKDHMCKGGYAHLEGVTCPYVMMNGYKFVAIQDVLRMFPQCGKTCKVIRNVLVKYRGLSRTFCDRDQVYLLDQLFVLKRRSVKSGDILIRVDSLVKHLPSIRDHVREEHLNLRRQGKTTLQCVQQQT